MKKTINYLFIALLGLLSFSSCKKEKTIVPAETPIRKIAKIQDAAGSFSFDFAYDATGRLSEFKSGFYSYVFDNSKTYQADIFINNKRDKQISATTVTNGKVMSLDYTRFKADGSVNYVDVYNYQYGADGYATGYTYTGYEYTKEHSNGNLVKVSSSQTTGSFSNSRDVEYYTDKPAKLNLNLFEALYLNDFINDRNLFGPRNRNLPKKVTLVNYAGYTESLEFSYILDTEGYMTSYTVTYITPASAPVVTTYNVSYQ